MKNALFILLLSTVAGCNTAGTGPDVVTNQTAPQARPSSPSTPAPAPIPGSKPTPSPGPTPGPAPTTPNVNVDNNSFSGLLNNVRSANSASPVRFDARLSNAAQGHANDMLANNYFSHTGLNGSSAGDRITAAGYSWRTYGENIAQGHPTQEAVFQGWTNSPGHHANNINPNFKDFGLAKAGTGGAARWVLVLATEK